MEHSSEASAENQTYILTKEDEDEILANEILKEKNRYRITMRSYGLDYSSVEQRIEQQPLNFWIEKINTEALFTRCNELKKIQIAEEQRRKEREDLEQQRIKEINRICNHEYFYNKIRRYFIEENNEFHFDENNEQYIKAICYLLAEDDRYEKELNFSFKKGLLVMGTPGLGKTSTIQAVADNPKHPIQILHILKIEKAVAKSGEFFFNTNRLTLIDDVGTENHRIKYFGTEINWFKNFIEDYYISYSTYCGLIITTNLNADEFEDRYGYRVRSRLREMFNIIELKGKDKRK